MQNFRRTRRPIQALYWHKENYEKHHIAMRKTAILLVLAALAPAWCRADDIDISLPEDPVREFGEQMILHTPDFGTHFDALPQDVEPSFADPAFHLFMEETETDWTQDHFHFNYLLEEDSALA